MTPSINPHPSTAADYAANIRALRVVEGQKLGLPITDGTPAEYNGLSKADQIRLTDEMSAYIVGNISEFSPGQVKLARDRVNSPNFRKPIADTSLTAAAGEFFSDYANSVQAKFTQIIIVTVIAGIITKFAVDAIAKAATAKK